MSTRGRYEELRGFPSRMEFLDRVFALPPALIDGYLCELWMNVPVTDLHFTIVKPSEIPSFMSWFHCVMSWTPRSCEVTVRDGVGDHIIVISWAWSPLRCLDGVFVFRGDSFTRDMADECGLEHALSSAYGVITGGDGKYAELAMDKLRDFERDARKFNGCNYIYGNYGCIR